MKWAPSLLLLLAMTACTSTRTSTDYDKAVDFSRYKTYAWTRGVEASDSLTEERIHRAVDRELAARGFSKVETSPSLQVATHASTSPNQQVDINSFGYGVGEAGWGPDSPMVNVRDVDVGTLMVDLVDASSQKLVWRGELTGAVGYSVPEAKINKAAAKIFARFPVPKG